MIFTSIVLSTFLASLNTEAYTNREVGISNKSGTEIFSRFLPQDLHDKDFRNVELRNIPVSYLISRVEYSGSTNGSKIEVCRGSLTIPVLRLSIENGGYVYSAKQETCTVNFKKTADSQTIAASVFAAFHAVVIPKGYEDQGFKHERHLGINLEVYSDQKRAVVPLRSVESSIVKTTSALKDGTFEIWSQDNDNPSSENKGDSIVLDAKFDDENSSDLDFNK